MKFAEILRELLSEFNLNQTELAKKIGVKPSQVSEWLKGKANPGYETLRTIATALGVASGYLLGLENDSEVIMFAPIGEAAPTEKAKNEQERELLQSFRELSPYLQGVALDTVRGWANKPSGGGLHKKA